jgi:hypothetical protein
MTAAFDRGRRALLAAAEAIAAGVFTLPPAARHVSRWPPKP